MAKEHDTNPEPGLTGDAIGWTILLADDEAGIRQLAGQVLRSHGYTVLEAVDGVEALEVAEQHPGADPPAPDGPVLAATGRWGTDPQVERPAPGDGHPRHVGLYGCRGATQGRCPAQAVPPARPGQHGKRGARIQFQWH